MFNVYISFTESITEVHILGYTEVDILCALSLHAVVLRAVEVRACHEDIVCRSHGPHQCSGPMHPEGAVPAVW